MNKQDSKQYNEMVGQMLIALIKEHKASCNSADCGISVFCFLKVFEDIVGRKSTPEEQKVFF